MADIDHYIPMIHLFRLCCSLKWTSVYFIVQPEGQHLIPNSTSRFEHCYRTQWSQPQTTRDKLPSEIVLDITALFSMFGSKFNFNLSTSPTQSPLLFFHKTTSTEFFEWTEKSIRKRILIAFAHKPESQRLVPNSIHPFNILTEVNNINSKLCETGCHVKSS